MNNSNMIDFRNNDINDLEKKLINNGFNENKIKNFKTQFKSQLINKIEELKNIKNLPKHLKLFPFQPLTLFKSIKDQYKNEKYIFKTHDNYFIESVLMPDKKNISICVSVQVGCKFNCLFCNTGKMGFKRNLSKHEILDQIRQIYQIRIMPYPLSCISFMGMGEPLDNLLNCMNALDWINSDWGWQVSREKVTFSTSGIISLKKLFKYEKLPNLAVSIHSAYEKKRKWIMPSAKISLKKLKKQMIEYTKITGNQVSIEYCLLFDYNDSKDDIYKLIDYIYGLPCKVNLLNYNHVKGAEFYPVSDAKIEEVKSILKEYGIPVIYRKSLGTEIGAGCGQLGCNPLDL